jgi:hypothetical protein
MLNYFNVSSMENKVGKHCNRLSVASVSVTSKFAEN